MTEKMGVRIATITKEFQVDWRNTSQELENNAEQKHCYEIFHNRKQICPKCGVKEVFETGKRLSCTSTKIAGSKMDNVVGLRHIPHQLKKTEKQYWPWS